MANIGKITVLGRATATTYQIDSDPGVPVVLVTVNNITADTDNLLPGMTIIFSDDFGGLVADQEYYILSEGFTTTNFRVSLTDGGPSVTLTDTSGIVSFTAFKEVTTTGTKLLYTYGISTPQIDYTEQINGIQLQLSRIADSLETSDSSRLADNIQAYKELAAGSGIHMSGPFDWLGLMSIYKTYVDNPDTAIGLEALEAYKAKIDSLPKSF